MTTYARDARPDRRPHVSPWVVAVIGLAMVAVALGAWAVLRGGESRSQDEVLVDQVAAAWNARDGDAIGRLYTRDAVLTSEIDSPMATVGLEKLKALARNYWNTVVPLAEPTTLEEPPGGFSKLTRGIDPHYVLVPVLIHDDVFVTLFEVRGGKIATHIVFEPFEPVRE